MSKENVIAFNRKMHHDPELQGRIQSLMTGHNIMPLSEIISLADIAGLPFTLTEFKENHDGQLFSARQLQQLIA